MDLNDEIDKIISMYEDARKNDEANDPSAYHKPVDITAKPNKGLGGKEK